MAAVDAGRAGPAGPLALSLAQWRSVLSGVRAASERANLPLIAGGVAFFGLMAAIPGIAALVALVGVLGEPAWVGEQIRALAGVAPDAVVSVIYSEISRLLAARDESLVLGALFNLALALWSALQGTRWTLMALTAVNRRAEPRALVRRFLAAGTFTLYGLGLGALAVMLMGVAPIALALLPMNGAAETLLLVCCAGRFSAAPPSPSLSSSTVGARTGARRHGVGFGRAPCSRLCFG